MERKNTVFQTLKPLCVALSQATLTWNGSQGDSNAVTKHLDTLKNALDSLSSKPASLDAKLAEYVFFPISQVLKSSQKATIRILELCLQCVAILIAKGWRERIPSQLAGQLVIFCSMLGEKSPKKLSFAEATAELQVSAFECLYQLFSVVRHNSDTAESLRSEANFPQLGQTISVILEGIEHGGSAEVQITSTMAFGALLSNVMDVEVQASFLPGIVSKLTKILTPQTSTRRNHKVLIGCLYVLETLLRNTMSDAPESQAVRNNFQTTSQKGQERENSIMNAEWREEAASQLNPALLKISRLRAHSRADVRDALGKFCSMVIQYCCKTLANCLHLALETLITISAAESATDTHIELEMLVRSDASIPALLQDVLYEWLQSITTIMQGSDEQIKSSKMRQITVAYGLLSNTGADTSTIDRIFATTLRDIVIVTLDAPSSKHPSRTQLEPFQTTNLTSLNTDANTTDFDLPLVRVRGQQGAMSSVEHAARLISSSTSGSGFAGELARDLKHSQGQTQIANFWLLQIAIQAMLEQQHQIDDLINFDNASHAGCNEYIEEMYALSLTILTGSNDHPLDPQLQALALRALALQAQTAGYDFRYDLVDALYPVLHTLATPNEDLQRDSIVALNVFSSACGYSSVKDLIVENVDYLTNAVALKLNAFDVSPQGPQVLLMMVRLAGPSLLSYLQDTVESIFAALEDYHGYPLLVELLFKVLGVIADEGVKTPQLAITDGKHIDADLVLGEGWHPTSIAGLANLLREDAEEQRERVESTIGGFEAHPKRPWKETDDSQEDQDETIVDRRTEMDIPEAQPPAPKTYNLLWKITDLTQHFLPSASPSLRASLLSLIVTTTPAIAKHENSFLPLINTLWPEIVSRLDDQEAFVVSNALEVVTVLCEHAREFLRSRIAQLWPRLGELHHSVSQAVSQLNLHNYTERVMPVDWNQIQLHQDFSASNDQPSTSTTSSLSGDTSTRRLKSNLVICITAIVRFVQISPEMVDQALSMLQPSLRQEDVQRAFAEENSDALWLAQLRNGGVKIPDVPVSPRNLQWSFIDARG